MTTCNHIVVDAFPSVTVAKLSHLVGATISCWIPSAKRGDDEVVSETLSKQGWELARVTSRGTVDASAYADDAASHAHYARALANGFGAHVHATRRESISLDDKPQAGAAVLETSCLDLFAQGGWSLFSSEDGHWVNGVSRDGDNYLPLWASEQQVEPWAPKWPGYEAKRMSPAELLGPGGLADVLVDADMRFALGAAGKLLTVHPMALKRHLA